MGKLLQRDNKIYKEIESFEDYELNICISYEFAIRNNEVIKLIEKFLNLHSKNLLSNYDYKPILSTDIFRDKTSRYYNMYAIELMDKKLISVLNLFLDYPWFDNVIKQYKEKEDQYIKQRTNYELEKIKDIDNFLEYKSLLRNKRKYINEYNLIFFQYNSNNMVEDKDDDFIFRYVSKNSYTLHQTYCTNDTHQIMTNTIKPNYQRPELLGIFSKIKSYNIEINQNLPKNDIESFVKTVINDIYSNNIVKSYSEILGEELKKAHENLYINKKTNKVNTQTIADMFYIYDAIKKGIKKSKIQMDISCNNGKVLVDYKTINKYFDIAEEYIENIKYQELITNIKS